MPRSTADLLGRELARWEEAGARCRLWLRNDDVSAPSTALMRLLALCGSHAVPLLLAVTPCEEARKLELPGACEGVWVGQHGIDHHNRRRLGRPSQFARSEPASDIAKELADAGGWLAGLPGFLPVYIPPWNTVSANVIKALPQAGFSGLSGLGAAMHRDCGLLRIDAHLDIMSWMGRPRFRGATACRRALAHLLSQRREAGAWHEPLGLLTHHWALDEYAWWFLDVLFRDLASTSGVGWATPRDLFSPSVGAIQS